jgi:hypothetical protein
MPVVSADDAIGRCLPLITVVFGAWSPGSRCHAQHSDGASSRNSTSSGLSGSGEVYTCSGIFATMLDSTDGGEINPNELVARSAAAVVSLTFATPSGNTT